MNIRNALTLTNAKVVLDDKVVDGSVVVENGIITDVYEGASKTSNAVDLNGDYLIPGLIELHTDNMEKYFVPRPGVEWPGQSAVLAHDAQIVGAGITTVFDAVAIGDINEKSYRMENLQRMITALAETANKKLCRAEHFLHLRCEVSNSKCVELFQPLAENALVHLVSIMDHSPGQRQFVRMDKYIQYYQGKFKLSDDEMASFIESQKQNSKKFSAEYRKKIATYCAERNIPLASHDDATTDHVEEAVSYNMSIAEFPTTLEAAKASHQSGLKVLMGAPNIIRGSSHSGNVAASELATKGVLDILSSDYYPASLMEAAFKLVNLDNDFDIPSAINTVTKTPALAAGLDDRGIIKTGLRADLVHVHLNDGFPQIKKVWNQGNRVA